MNEKRINRLRDMAVIAAARGNEQQYSIVAQRILDLRRPDVFRQINQILTRKWIDSGYQGGISN